MNNIITMKNLMDVAALIAWVGVAAALVYGLEIAGLQLFLTRMGYYHSDTFVPPL